MQMELDKVREFMEKQGQGQGERLPSSRNVHLETASQSIIIAAAVLETHVLKGDLRVLRAHLMCEELAEVLFALEGGNRTDLLDGLADLLYVTLGTAVAFNLPLQGAFDEIHRSNMTKNARSPETDPRVRVKGSSYKPPNLGGL